MAFWRAPGWMSRERPVPWARALPARAKPAHTSKIRVFKRMSRNSSETDNDSPAASRAEHYYTAGAGVNPGILAPPRSAVEHHETALGGHVLARAAAAVGLAPVDVDLEQVHPVGERVALVVQAVPGELDLVEPVERAQGADQLAGDRVDAQQHVDPVARGVHHELAAATRPGRAQRVGHQV